MNNKGKFNGFGRLLKTHCDNRHVLGIIGWFEDGLPIESKCWFFNGDDSIKTTFIIQSEKLCVV